MMGSSPALPAARRLQTVFIKTCPQTGEFRLPSNDAEFTPLTTNHYSVEPSSSSQGAVIERLSRIEA